ncbi:hypothetical protein [Nonomuraea sp. 10N515B]|uniref:hypothetical protein n=1 Tax=Nonomuraea sp. 10N515B TaxID=3457422 RepID=UPI003FCD2FE9
MRKMLLLHGAAPTYCWGEMVKHHDIALVDEAGTVLAQRRVAESPQGYEELLTLMAGAIDSAEALILVVIETRAACSSLS